MDGACQVCGSGDFEDYVKHDEGYNLRCRSCGLVFNAHAEELMARAAVEHYDDPAYFEGYESRLGKKLRSARRRLDLVASFVPSGRLLDIGCGIGDSLLAAREAGYDAVGLDVGEYPVAHCRKLGFEVHQASISDTGLEDESFDVVTMWDVVEHIPRSADGLREVARILRPGGVAALVTPTSSYIKAHVLRNTYHVYRGPWAKTHFVYHTPATLRRVLEESGLDVQRLPLVHAGAMRRGGAAAVVEIATAAPRYAVRRARSVCRLSRNLFVVARKRT